MEKQNFDAPRSFQSWKHNHLIYYGEDRKWSIVLMSEGFMGRGSAKYRNSCRRFLSACKIAIAAAQIFWVFAILVVVTGSSFEGRVYAFDHPLEPIAALIIACFCSWCSVLIWSGRWPSRWVEQSLTGGCVSRVFGIFSVEVVHQLQIDAGSSYHVQLARKFVVLMNRGCQPLWTYYAFGSWSQHRK